MRSIFFLWVLLSVLQGYAAFNLTWGIPAVSLHSNPPVGDTDANAAIAIDPMGNAIATWSRTTGKGASEDIWAASYNHSSRTWTGAVKISGGGIAANARVAMDANGHAWIVWEEGIPSQIMCRILSAKGVWSPDLSSPPLSLCASKNAQVSPQIKVTGSGNALALWMEYSEKRYHIHSAKKSSDTSWIHLGRISSGLRSAVLSPTKPLSLNDAGDAIAVWQEINGSSSEIHGARYVHGTWLSPIAVFAEQGKSGQFPSAGIDAKGNAVIVWTSANTIRSKTIREGLLSSTPLTISNPAYVALRPDVGIDAIGNAIVVFERHNSMHKFIAGALLLAGETSWSFPHDISGPSPIEAAAAGHPVLALNAIGDGIVIWKEYTGTNMIIQGAGYSLGTWSLVKTLSALDDTSGAPAPAYDIAVSVNLAGNILAVWPEDSSGKGTCQIKATPGAGLANTAPLPPLVEPSTLVEGIALGDQTLHRFPAHSDLINTLTWTIPSAGISYYKIYRGNLSTLIGTSTTPRYEDHQRIPNKQETYLITSVDANGQESCPVTLVVKRPKNLKPDS